MVLRSLWVLKNRRKGWREKRKKKDFLGRNLAKKEGAGVGDGGAEAVEASLWTRDVLNRCLGADGRWEDLDLAISDCTV